MSKNMYAIVGNFGFDSEPKGLSVYRYSPEDGSLEPAGSFLDHVSVGGQCFDDKRKVLYMVDERARNRKEFGGGGYILSATIDRETGACVLLNEKETLAPKPAYVSLDGRGEFALVAHHVNRDRVVRIVKDGGGRYQSETLVDDTPLALFPLRNDGGLGDIADMMIFKGEGEQLLHGISHLHSVIPDPSGEFFIVCDKGLDRIYCLRINRGTGHLELTHTEMVTDGSAPRYGAYHPSLPLVYLNNESMTIINCYRYDRARGDMEFYYSAPVLMPDVEGKIDRAVEVAACDILIHPSGDYLYSTARGANCISLYRIDRSGKPVLMDNIPCGGINPRGLCLSPDGKFLYVMNIVSGSVNAFALDETGGELKELGIRAWTAKPANMTIITL